MDQTADTVGRIVKATLTHSALHALKWRYVGTIFQVGLRFAVGVVLARLLSPEAFGVVGIALIAIGLVRLVGDLGFGVAVIQRSSITHEHVQAAFTGSVIMGLLLFAALWCLAPSMSRAFMHDTLTPILRMIGISVVFSGVSATPVCMLRRELRFRTLAGIEAASYMVGFGVVGVALAVSGYGVWSLVAANMLQPLCLAVLAVYVTRQPVRPYFGAQAYRDLCRVASAEVLNNVTNYLAENFDFFVIGKCIGASALGLYTRSFYVMRLPVTHFSVALSSVMFPLYAKIQEDVPRLGRAFLRTVSLTAIVTMPVFFAMAAAPGVVIGGLFGAQWKAAAGALQILSFCGPCMAITLVFGALSHARGYVFSECGRQGIYLVVMGISLWFLLPRGIEGVALAVALATVARYLLLAQLSVQLAGVRWKHFFLAQVPGGLFGLTIAASVYLAGTVGDLFAMSDVLQLLMIVVVSLVSLTGSFWVFPTSWSGDLYPWVLERFGVNLPPWLRRVIAAKVTAVRPDAMKVGMMMR